MKTAGVLCIDKNYVEPAAVFLDSLSENYHYWDDLDIVCVMPEKDATAFQTLTSLVSLKLNINLKLKVALDADYAWLEDIKSDRRTVNPSTWHRLFLGSLLEGYDKAIYFDPDMLVVKDVQPIFSHPMYGMVMATFDTIGVPYMYGLEHGGDLVHFVSGLMIINLDLWRKSNVESLIKQDLLNNELHVLIDEYYLNKYLVQDWHPLPVTFNFISFKHDKYGVPDWDSTFLPRAYYEHAIIFHFAGKIKPWNFAELTGIDSSKLGAEWRRRRELLETSREPEDIR